MLKFLRYSPSHVGLSHGIGNGSLVKMRLLIDAWCNTDMLLPKTLLHSIDQLATFITQTLLTDRSQIYMPSSYDLGVEFCIWTCTGLNMTKVSSKQTIRSTSNRSLLIYKKLPHGHMLSFVKRSNFLYIMRMNNSFKLFTLITKIRNMNELK